MSRMADILFSGNGCLFKVTKGCKLDSGLYAVYERLKSFVKMQTFCCVVCVVATLV